MTSERDDEAAVRAVIDTWHRATSASDLARVLPLMAEDAIFLAPERQPMRGRAACQQALAALLETHTITSSGEVRKLEAPFFVMASWTQSAPPKAL